MDRRKYAEDAFEKGYNCSQSILAAFIGEDAPEREALLRSISPLGGGMGRLREVCGAVSGMFYVLGMYRGYLPEDDHDAKTDLYRSIHELAKRFREKNEFLRCEDLLHAAGLEAPKTPEGSNGANASADNRPCRRLIGDAAEILDRFLQEQDIEK